MRSFKKKSKNIKEDNSDTKKEIGIIEGVSIISGIIIGSGIFVSPIGVLEYTNSVGLSLIMWAFTGVVCLLGALVYAELGVTIQKSGGEYSYILETFGPMLAFLALWITFVVIGAASVAANSLVIAEYLLKGLPFLCDIQIEAKILLAYFAMLILAYVNSYNFKLATRISEISSFFKFAALILIFIFGIITLTKGNVENFQDAFEGSSYSPGSLAIAFYRGSWAFMGWNYLNFVVGDVNNPGRNVPIIILLSLALVTIVYLLANIAYLAVLSPHTLLSEVGSGGSAVAVAFARACMGDFYYVMPVIVGISVFGSVNGEMITMSRLAFRASEEGHMHALISMVHVNYKTPFPAVVLLTILSLAFALYRDVGYLIELAGLSFTIISDMAVLSLLYIRRYRPETNKTKFKLPVIVPLLFLLINSGIGALTIYQSPSQSGLGLLLMLSGLPVYLIFVVWHKPPSWQAWLNKFTVLMQKVLNSVEKKEKDCESEQDASDGGGNLSNESSTTDSSKL